MLKLGPISLTRCADCGGLVAHVSVGCFATYCRKSQKNFNINQYQQQEQQQEHHQRQRQLQEYYYQQIMSGYEHRPNTAIRELEEANLHGGHCAQSFKFAPQQHRPAETRVGRLIAAKVAEQRFFYGVEITPSRAIGNSSCLDFNTFGNFLPLFASIVWLGNVYWNVKPIECVGALKLACQLAEHMPAVPHFTAYRLSKERLAEFTDLKLNNMLALRGDQVDPAQPYSHGADIVAEARRLRGDTISIGVAGYPDGHPEMASLKDDMHQLRKKVNAGADYIITQICFSAEAIIDFVKRCRAAGIHVPIVMGVIIPRSMRAVHLIDLLGHVHLDATELTLIRTLSKEDFHEYFINRAVSLISEVLAAKVGIYGVQFYSLNHFHGIQTVLERLRAAGCIS